MMKAKIEVEMDNAAFGEYPQDELRRILLSICEDIDNGFSLRGNQWLEDSPRARTLRDSNGNRVGQLVIED